MVCGNSFLDERRKVIKIATSVFELKKKLKIFVKLNL
jgi:hypothetical protein